MDSGSDQASGIANVAIGKVKQGVGNLVGSEKLQTEGTTQEAKGETQKAIAAKAPIKGRRPHSRRQW